MTDRTYDTEGRWEWQTAGSRTGPRREGEVAGVGGYARDKQVAVAFHNDHFLSPKKKKGRKKRKKKGGVCEGWAGGRGGGRGGGSFFQFVLAYVIVWVTRHIIMCRESSAIVIFFISIVTPLRSPLTLNRQRQKKEKKRKTKQSSSSSFIIIVIIGHLLTIRS